MFIHELGAEMDVTLDIHDDYGRSAQLSTKVKSVIGEFIIKLYPIRHEGKLLNFNSVTCALDVVVKDKLRRFTLDKMELIRSEDPYYRVVCTKPSKPMNRRQAVRVRVGSPTILDIGRGSRISGCYVYDISCTGAGFTVPSGESISIGDTVKAAFKYKWDDTLYQVEGTVVRIVPLEKGNYLRVGVSFNQLYISIDRLIADIQRDEAIRLRKERRK